MLIRHVAAFRAQQSVGCVSSLVIAARHSSGVPIAPGTPLGAIANSVGGAEQEYLNQRLRRDTFRAELDRRADNEWYARQYTHKKQAKQIDEVGIEAAVQEHLQPKNLSYRAQLKQQPLDRRILEELYRELHGKRTERRLRKGVFHEHFVANDDRNAPVLKGTNRAQQAFAFGGQVSFVRSAGSPVDFPVSKVPEIAFYGRSNSGRSSLINALVNGYVCPYGALPGTTKTANFYDVGGKLTIVDLPGYGYYAPLQATPGAAQNAMDVSAQYLRASGRRDGALRNLKRVFVCVAPSGLQHQDEAVIETLANLGVPFSVVVMKSDIQPIKFLARVLNDTRSRVSRYPECKELFVTSAMRLAGITRLQNLVGTIATPVAEVESPIDRSFDSLV